MIGDLPDDGRITLGTDKGYDTQDFVAEMRRLGMTPHVTQNTRGRRSAIDGRTTRHVGYAVSLRIRKRIEEVFGWMKTVGGLRKTRHRGTARVGWMFTFVAAAWLGRRPLVTTGVLWLRPTSAASNKALVTSYDPELIGVERPRSRLP